MIAIPVSTLSTVDHIRGQAQRRRLSVVEHQRCLCECRYRSRAVSQISKEMSRIVSVIQARQQTGTSIAMTIGLGHA